MATSPEDRADAIELMKQAFIKDGMSPEDAAQIVPVIVDEAIERKDSGEE
jgi:hypothetical protein